MVGLVRPLVETVRPSGRSADRQVGRRLDGRLDEMGQLGSRGNAGSDAIGLVLGVGVGRTDRTTSDRHGEAVVVGRRRVGMPIVIGIVIMIGPAPGRKRSSVVYLACRHVVGLVVRPP